MLGMGLLGGENLGPREQPLGAAVPVHPDLGAAAALGPHWLAHSSMPAFEAASLALPLGGWGHHGALVQQAGMELPEVKGSRAAKSQAKPGFPLPPGRRAFSSSSAQPSPGSALLHPC